MSKFSKEMKVHLWVLHTYISSKILTIDFFMFCKVYCVLY